MESNFSETYPYVQLGERFRFLTVQGIVVTVDLSRDSRYFPDNPEIGPVCNFFIETDKPSMGLDVRLRDTVLKIVRNFLRQYDAIIIYHCDPHDGRGYLRHAKFNRWFSMIDDPSIEKQDREVTIIDLKVGEKDNLIRSELPVYASMVMRKTHPDYEAAIRIFHSGDMDKSGKL